MWPFYTIFLHQHDWWRYWGNEVGLTACGLFILFFYINITGEDTGAMSFAALFINFFLVCLDAQLPIFPKLVYNYIAY